MYDYAAGKLDWLAAGLPTEGRLASKPAAKDVARSDVPKCSLEDALGDIRDRTRAAGVELCVVVNQEDIVLGLLRSEELDGPDERKAEDAMRPGPSTFRPHVPISELAHYMSDHDMPHAPITTSEGKLMGVVFREDAEREAHGDR